MDLLSNNNKKLQELFDEYIHLLPDSEVDYYPDFFIKDIHRAYLKDNKTSLLYPIYATWDIIDVCNINCLFCSANSRKVDKQIISNKNAIQIAKKVIDIGIKYISIRGGEPTLCKELIDVVIMFNQASVFVEIVTNGTNINDSFIKNIKFLNTNLIRIKISLDSPNKYRNDSQRGDNSFLYATRAIKCCNKYQIKFRIQMVITKTNYNDVEEMYEFCNINNSDSFGAMLLLPIGRGISSDLRVSLNKEIITQFINIIKLKKTTKIEKLGFGVDAIQLYEKHFKESSSTIDDGFIQGHLKCNALKTRIYIASTGKLYPCDLLKYDEFYLGNILCEDIYEVWNSPKAISFRNINRKTRQTCSKCDFYDCNMGCYAISYANSINKSNLIPNCKL